MLADVGHGFLINALLTGGILAVCVLLLWALSVRLRNISVIDIFWGPGFALVALASYLHSAHAGIPERRALVTVLTVAWGLRLGVHLLVRNHGKPEDARYTAAFRDRYPRHLHMHTLVKVFLLQGALIWLISMPVQLAAFLRDPPTLGSAAIAGSALWLVGFLFEAISDWQLARFKADPANRGRIMDRGLWRYTRHPNYFGNACLWWGLALIACDSPAGILTLYAPLLMTYFLVNVTGKRLLEARMSQAHPDYAAYVRRTSGFFPWPPRRD